MAPSTPRAAAAGGATATAARKREQAQRATASGPPAGFGPVESDPAPPAPTTAAAPQQGRAPRFTGGPDWGDGGGFLFGLLAYTLTLAYIRHGKAGVIGWLKAKMINEPTQFPSEPVPGNLSRHDVTA